MRKPARGTAKLWLTITINDKATIYSLASLEADPGPAWRLRKTDGTEYTVHVDAEGEHCTCGDFVWCREHKDRRGCKHVAACRARGLLK